jgi:hypothetical protein
MKNTTRTLLLLLLSVSPALATPTGLNNIPTADVVPHRTVAVQAFSSFGDGANQFAANGAGEHSFWLGFKTGWDLSNLNLEWGLDSPVITGNSGPLLFQTKVNFEPWEGGALALGVANVALTDTDRAGDPFSYAMLAHDFGFIRVHAGYGLQNNGNSVLLGLDRTWKVFDRNFNLNVDLVQAADESIWLPAVGWKYDLSKHIVLEWWSNLPDQGKSSHIAKINFVFQF